MYQFNQTSRVRPYYVDKTLDSFKRTEGIVPDMIAQELLAYYRGEEVTRSFIEHARSVFCTKSNPPIPLPEEQSITIKCNNGEDSLNVSMATLARNYDLIADLYELDPTMKELTLPFDLADVVVALPSDYRSTCYMAMASAPIEVLKFLRPKRTELYIEYPHWNEKYITEDFCRMVGSGLEEETKLHLSRFARVFPDKDLYPIVAKFFNSNNHTITLSKLLEVKAPSVLLWCCVSCMCKDCKDRALELIGTSSFEDTLPVVQPVNDFEFGIIGHDGNNVELNKLKSLYNEVLLGEDDKARVRVLIALGDSHSLMEKIYPVPKLPFACQWQWPVGLIKRTYDKIRRNK